MKSSSKRFEPRVIAVSKNATVEFPNADPIYHNVFSVSGANRFDLGLYRSGSSKSKTFDEPGLVRIYCNIHPQMVGFVMVVDSDFVAVTGPDGAFRFDNVPAGTVRRQGLERGGQRSLAARHGQGRRRRLRSRSASTSRASRPSRTRTSTARTTPRTPARRPMSATEAPSAAGVTSGELRLTGLKLPPPEPPRFSLDDQDLR